MRIVAEIIKLLTLYCSMMNKRDSNIWIFGAWFGEKFADNPKYLYLYCLEQGINAIWFTHNEQLYNEMISHNLPVCMIGSKEANRTASHAKYNVFCTDRTDTDYIHTGGAVNINLWHGIPIKKIGYDNKKESFRYTMYYKIREIIWYLPTRKTYHFSTSDKLTEIFKSCFKTDSRHVIQIGQARNDCFFNGCLKKQSYKSIEYAKAVVYMPTHRNEGKTKIDVTKIFDLGKLNLFCKDNSILFVIKKHFYHKHEETDLTQLSNIVDITQNDVDSQELLYNADVLVTDFSGCYIDYLLLDRPIIFYNYDYGDYILKDRELYFDYNAVTPGTKARNFDEFIEALEDAVNENSHYLKKQNEVKNLFYSKENQGEVCPGLCDAIRQLT